MADFKIGDKVRFKDGSPHDDNKDHYVSDLNLWYVYLDGLNNRSGQGMSPGTLELVDETMPQTWQDKIEKALGRDALVTLGVVKPLPKKQPAVKVEFYVTDGSADYVEMRITETLAEYTGFILLGEVTATPSTYTEEV